MKDKNNNGEEVSEVESSENKEQSVTNQSQPKSVEVSEQSVVDKNQEDSAPSQNSEQQEKNKLEEQINHLENQIKERKLNLENCEKKQRKSIKKQIEELDKQKKEVKLQLDKIEKSPSEGHSENPQHINASDNASKFELFKHNLKHNFSPLPSNSNQKRVVLFLIRLALLPTPLVYLLLCRFFLTPSALNYMSQFVARITQLTQSAQLFNFAFIAIGSMSLICLAGCLAPLLVRNHVNKGRPQEKGLLTRDNIIDAASIAVVIIGTTLSGFAAMSLYASSVISFNQTLIISSIGVGFSTIMSVLYNIISIVIDVLKGKGEAKPITAAPSPSPSPSPDVNVDNKEAKKETPAPNSKALEAKDLNASQQPNLSRHHASSTAVNHEKSASFLKESVLTDDAIQKLSSLSPEDLNQIVSKTKSKLSQYLQNSALEHKKDLPSLDNALKSFANTNIVNDIKESKLKKDNYISRIKDIENDLANQLLEIKRLSDSVASIENKKDIFQKSSKELTDFFKNNHCMVDSGSFQSQDNHFINSELAWLILLDKKVNASNVFNVFGDLNYPLNTHNNTFPGANQPLDISREQFFSFHQNPILSSPISLDLTDDYIEYMNQQRIYFRGQLNPEMQEKCNLNASILRCFKKVDYYLPNEVEQMVADNRQIQQNIPRTPMCAAVSEHDCDKIKIFIEDLKLNSMTKNDFFDFCSNKLLSPVKDITKSRHARSSIANFSNELYDCINQRDYDQFGITLGKAFNFKNKVLQLSCFTAEVINRNPQQDGLRDSINRFHYQSKHTPIFDISRTALTNHDLLAYQNFIPSLPQQYNYFRNNAQFTTPDQCKVANFNPVGMSRYLGASHDLRSQLLEHHSIEELIDEMTNNHSPEFIGQIDPVLLNFLRHVPLNDMSDKFLELISCQANLVDLNEKHQILIEDLKNSKTSHQDLESDLLQKKETLRVYEARHESMNANLNCSSENNVNIQKILKQCDYLFSIFDNDKVQKCLSSKDKDALHNFSTVFQNIEKNIQIFVKNSNDLMKSVSQIVSPQDYDVKNESIKKSLELLNSNILAIGKDFNYVCTTKSDIKDLLAFKFAPQLSKILKASALIYQCRDQLDFDNQQKIDQIFYVSRLQYQRFFHECPETKDLIHFMFKTYIAYSDPKKTFDKCLESFSQLIPLEDTFTYLIPYICGLQFSSHSLLGMHTKIAPMIKKHSNVDSTQDPELFGKIYKFVIKTLLSMQDIKQFIPLNSPDCAHIIATRFAFQKIDCADDKVFEVKDEEEKHFENFVKLIVESEDCNKVIMDHKTQSSPLPETVTQNPREHLVVAQPLEQHS